ncbi:TD and POZ domain-containing protein 1 [Caerostris darwini]|uniref:TD and POZ domain-containing protein 1 n=1 Tax=Caerostris darwini TaxID=1538125 RepID=A0AAV4R5Z4_9ARAC|nr:TD and POZ domain-containing protein 1 [Caerostris darwini]
MATKVNSGMKYFVFTWTVKNFSYWWQRSPDRIVSPTYIVNAIENTKWKLCTYKKNNDNEKISLLLNREEDNYSSDIVLDYELAILAADESTLVTGTKEDQTFKKGFGFGFSLSAIEINKLIEKQTKLPCHFKVRCRMWYGKGKLMEVGHCFALTRFQVEKFCFNWVIKDFSNLNYDDNVALLMKSDSDDPLMAFNLSLLKKEQSESEIIAIGIIAHRNVKHVNFESHIVDADGDKHLCGKEDFIFCGTGKVGSFELNRTKQTLMDIKNNYLKDNTLSLNCECTLSGGKMYETIEKNHFGVISTDSEIEVFKSKLVHPSSDLQDALMFMYDDAILSDVELRTSTKTFRVHKNILSARSPSYLYNNHEVIGSKVITI